MALDVNDEILQDFLVEASEILEKLSEQLVELEAAPNDEPLLNSIFRGFHTIKGGAGFLSLNYLVEICHIAENTFDLLRQGKKTVTADLMDVILKTVDAVNNMFTQIRGGEYPAQAPAVLLQQLADLTIIEPKHAPALESTAVPAPLQHNESIAKETVPTNIQNNLPNISHPEAENLEALFDKIQTSSQSILQAVEPITVAVESPKTITPTTVAKSQSPILPPSDTITDDEFEKLLDELKKTETSKNHNHKAEAKQPVEAKIVSSPTVMVPPIESKAPNENKVPSAAVANNPNLITDEEFEQLLDELNKIPKKAVESITKSVPPPVAVVSAPLMTPSPPINKQEPTHATAENAASRSQKIFAKQAPAKVEDEHKESTTVETTVRVDTSRLDEIMNMVGELVLVRNRLVKLRGNSTDEGMAKAVANLDVVTADLQMAVMKTRMQPIKKVFSRFPRVVRDLARSLHKEVVLELEGEETDLDKNLVEALSDPLVHLVRNAVDHGIETPQERQNANKPKIGKIKLSAAQAGDHILLSITDDGKGMDPEFLRKKAIEKGLMEADVAARLDVKECFNLIFAPGFSTKDVVSDISGRGVGMDVVKTKISQLNGSVDIESVKGVGSCIKIKVPLTLAILPTLMVVVGGQTFALPLTSVNEIFHLDLRKTNMVDGQLVILVREKAIPLFYLKEWLLHFNIKFNNHSNVSNENDHVVIVSLGTQRIGFVVDSLLGQEEVVIKALGDMLQGTPGMAGATITGDGHIAMILDVPGLLKKYARKVH